MNPKRVVFVGGAFLFCYLYWDPNPEIFRLPFFNWPVLWYGALFALSFILGFPIFVRILHAFFSNQKEKKECVKIADRLMVYMVLGTLLGARLGHFLFYERPSHYLRHPMDFFRIWEGGLASHGGALGIILVLILFSLRMKKEGMELSWIKLLDFVCIPAALGGALIRVGNFINQEILGTKTTLPWAVVFGHPADGSAPFPRHPVQLYESFFYLSLFICLIFLSKKESFLRGSGKLIGLFLTCVFSFRFVIEFLKVEQSHFLNHPTFTMGQILSIPLVLLGLFFFKKRVALSLENERNF